MAAVALDDAPGLTTVNQLWWMMVEDQKNAALDHALANYYNTFGYFKGQRNQQHLLFHSEAAPPGSDRCGVECAARSMPLIAPEFYKRTGSDFSKDTRHRLMEAFFYSLSKGDNAELYQHAVATTNVLSDLQRSPWYEEEGCPEVINLAALLDLRAKFVEKLQKLKGRRFQQF
jgi:nitroreductase